MIATNITHINIYIYVVREIYAHIILHVTEYIHDARWCISESRSSYTQSTIIINKQDPARSAKVTRLAQGRPTQVKLSL